LLILGLVVDPDPYGLLGLDFVLNLIGSVVEIDHFSRDQLGGIEVEHLFFGVVITSLIFLALGLFLDFFTIFAFDFGDLGVKEVFGVLITKNLNKEEISA
jgi:hypothetical protein